MWNDIALAFLVFAGTISVGALGVFVGCAADDNRWRHRAAWWWSGRIYFGLVFAYGFSAIIDILTGRI